MLEGKYFECNLNKEQQFHIHMNKQAEYYFAAQKIENRMQKLQDALDMIEDIEGLPMAGETFAKHAKLLFDNSFERFEDMTAEELARFVLSIETGLDKEPHRMDFPNAETVVDTAFVHPSDWEGVIRHEGVGGSDDAVVMGFSKWKTQRSLYYDKTATPILEQEDDDTPEEENPVFVRGHIVEPRVVEAFCEKMGATRIPETRMFRSKKYPNCLANIDAIVDVPGQGICIFEAKTTVLANRDAWENQIPLYYLPQMRHYAAVLDDDRIAGVHIGCIFVDDISIDQKYVGSGFNVDRSIFHYIPFDREKQDAQLKQVQEWWDTYVAEGVLPPRSGNFELDMEDMLTYEVRTDPSELDIPLSEEGRSLAEKYMELAEQKREIEKQVKGLEEAIGIIKVGLLEELDGHPSATLDLGDQTLKVENKQIKGRETTDVKKLQMKYPEAYDECVTRQAGSFRFSVSLKANRKKKSAAA